MKILAFTDIHADPVAFKNLKQKAQKEKPDLVVCCGDISNYGMDMQYSVKQMVGLGIKVLLIPGNHETSEEVRQITQKNPSIINLHNNFFEMDGVLFYGYGGGGFSYKDEAFEKIFPRILEKIPKDKKFVFVTHAPFFNTKLDKLPFGHRGNESAVKFVKKAKPVLALCGHFHENEKKEDKIGSCRVVNPGNDGMILEIK